MRIYRKRLIGKNLFEEKKRVEGSPYYSKTLKEQMLIIIRDLELEKLLGDNDNSQ